MKRLRNGLLLAALLAPLAVVGCAHPFSAGPLTPVPIQPWVTERMEEMYVTGRNDFRTPVMPPIRPGFPAPVCEDPPTEQQIVRAMPRVIRGIPFVCEEFRDDMQFVVERLVDKIDPPRFFPLVGPAQLHHCHYQCTITWIETIQSGMPFPCKLRKRRIEVVYIDKDHLHQCVGPDPAVQTQVTQDYTKFGY
jgi:hypothetical protein